MPERFIQNIEKYLRKGKTDPCYHLVLQFSRQAAEAPEAAAEAVGQCLDRLLDEFEITPVVEFCSDLETRLPPQLAEPIKKRAGKRVEMIRQWVGRISSVERERQAQQLRAAVRSRDLDRAEKALAAMLKSAGQGSADRTVVQYVGSVLGSVEHAQREAEQLIARVRQNPRRWQLDEELAELMEKARRERVAGMWRSRSEFPEAEYVRELNSMAVEMKRYLPDARRTGMPEESDVVRFYHVLHAVVAAVFLNGQGSRWTVVTPILVEFCPRELSFVGKRSGAEERAYMTLSPTARRVVFEAFGRLGRNEKVARSYLDFAETVGDERLLRNVVEVMGAMRSKIFFPWLRSLFQKESRPTIRSTIMTAASNYADGDSAEFLLRALAEAIRKGKRRGLMPEGPERRQAMDAIFALGRVVRSPRMDPGGRNEILKRAVALLPDKDERLRYELAYQCFRSRSEGWKAALRDWAAATLTRSFWLGDMTPEFAAEQERDAGVLSWRRPAVQALVSIGREAVPAILQACEDKALRYGGAYVAIAETLGEIGDERALDLLEHLVANVLLIDESSRTKYQVEKYFDPSEGVRKELTADQILAALLFAIERIGGDRADEILTRAYCQILAPGNEAVGSETSALLERVRARLTREGRWNEMVERIGRRRVNGRPEQDKTDTKRQAAQALKTLRSKVFWPGKRRGAKISAIQALASQCNLEALPLIVAHLADGDPLVRGAAETALGEYVWSAANDTVLRALFYALLEALASRDEKVRESVRNIIKRLGPNREPLRSKLVTLTHSETDPLLRAEASRLLREAQAPDVLESLGAGEAKEEPPEAADESEKVLAGRQRKRDLDEIIRRKREYLEARRAWIRGGKRGEPPKPPPEMQIE